MTVDIDILEIVQSNANDLLRDLILGYIELLRDLGSTDLDLTMLSIVNDEDLNDTAKPNAMLNALEIMARELLLDLGIEVTDDILTYDVLDILIAINELMRGDIEYATSLENHLVDSLDAEAGLTTVLSLYREKTYVCIESVDDKFMDLIKDTLSLLDISKEDLAKLDMRLRLFKSLYLTLPESLNDLSPEVLYRNKASVNIISFARVINIEEMPNVASIVYILLFSEDTFSNPRQGYIDNIEPFIDPLVIERVGGKIEDALEGIKL